MGTIAGFVLFVLTLTPQARDTERPRDDDHAGTAALSLTLRPSACLSGCSARAQVSLQPHADNRWLTLSFDSPRFRRSSGVSLDGKEASAFHSLTVEGLPAGHYVVQARLRRSTGEVFIKERSLTVKGRRR